MSKLQMWLVALVFLVVMLPKSAWSFDRDHRAFSEVLQRHVQNGLVDYTLLQGRRQPLDAYIEALGTVSRLEVESWSRNDQLAFWINAYNASTLQAIIDHYPLKRRGLKGIAFPSSSIWQIPGVWKGRTVLIAGEQRSLDDIEHGIIRFEFSEPRIHMALVCAAISCPHLREEAYVGTRLEQQLTSQTRKFLTDDRNGLRIDDPRRRIYVSRIFKWFKEDFVATASDSPRRAGKPSQAGLVEFLQRFADERTRNTLMNEDFSIRYLKYDWSLNERP